MAHAFNISEAGLELIKAYEGFRPVETVLVSGQKVIGYGHPYVRGEAALLTHQKAEDMLKADLEPIEKIINHIVFAPLSQNQFDALVSLAFNIGIDDFADSTVLHYLNNGQPLAAAAGFDEWRKSVIADQTYVIDALVRRRTAEKALFLSAASGIVAAPRYEVPVLHDSTVRSGAEDIEIFSKSDADGFVDQAPYEDAPVQESKNKAIPSGALMLSERVAAPQIYEDASDAILEEENLVSDVEIVAETDIEDEVIDNVVEIMPPVEIASDEEDLSGLEEEVETETEDEMVLENKLDDDAGNEFGDIVELNDEIEVEDEVESAAELDEEPAQDENLSPIALAAADVSERLDNLMEEEAETETEQETQIELQVENATEEAPHDENMNLVSALDFGNEEVSSDVVHATDEFVARETEVFATEVDEAETVEVEPLELESLELESKEAQQLAKERGSKLEQLAPKKRSDKNASGAGVFWTALIVGLLLIGGALWKMKFSPVVNMGEMGAFLAPVVLLVGAMMILGGMYYMVKTQLRGAAS